VKPARAAQVATAFVSRFADDAEFWTNGDLWRASYHPTGSWSPLTPATFDTGVVAVDDDAVGILWVTDED
jgi:hypothetical protein